ncbi:hypothetical protein HCC14_04930 [Streptococcus suis]|nr:hypothetical protein [Streptococcus suis]
MADFHDFFASHYPFVEAFSLVSAEHYATEVRQLPAWWEDDMARKDVLFYTEGMDKAGLVRFIDSLKLRDEILHISDQAIYWGKYSESSDLQTAYHKQLAKSPFYKQVTIRNRNTFIALSNYLNIEIKQENVIDL